MASIGKTGWVAAGVGIPGMRERVHERGGQFEIVSDENGTLVSVVLPVRSSMYQSRAM
jgi:signal transduction histidine kinase